MVDKWQIDLERMTASFGNFHVVLHRRGSDAFALEIANVPALREENALTLAGEAALALGEALKKHHRVDAAA